jgi:hypothetical protein
MLIFDERHAAAILDEFPGTSMIIVRTRAVSTVRRTTIPPMIDAFAIICTAPRGGDVARPGPAGSTSEPGFGESFMRHDHLRLLYQCGGSIRLLLCAQLGSRRSSWSGLV